jgi:hypothetical protein
MLDRLASVIFDGNANWKIPEKTFTPDSSNQERKNMGKISESRTLPVLCCPIAAPKPL